MSDQDSSSKYDQRHGGPWDRGSADSYYGRGYGPHITWARPAPAKKSSWRA